MGQSILVENTLSKSFRWSSVCLQCGRPGFNPWVRKSLGQRNGNPLQYSCCHHRSPPPQKKRLKEIFGASLIQFSSVQWLRSVWLFATPWIAACQASLSITNSRSSLKLMSIELVLPSSHLILCHPLVLLPPIPPSIRVFSNESTLRMRWPNYWSFSFYHHSFQRNPRADLLQNGLAGSPCSPRDSQESSPTPQFKASILWLSAFFTVQLSHPYMTAGKTIA